MVLPGLTLDCPLLELGLIAECSGDSGVDTTVVVTGELTVVVLLVLDPLVISYPLLVSDMELYVESLFAGVPKRRANSSSGLRITS